MKLVCIIKLNIYSYFIIVNTKAKFKITSNNSNNNNYTINDLKNNNLNIESKNKSEHLTNKLNSNNIINNNKVMNNAKELKINSQADAYNKNRTASNLSNTINKTFLSKGDYNKYNNETVENLSNCNYDQIDNLIENIVAENNCNVADKNIKLINKDIMKLKNQSDINISDKFLEVNPLQKIIGDNSNSNCLNTSKGNIYIDKSKEHIILIYVDLN